MKIRWINASSGFFVGVVFTILFAILFTPRRIAEVEFPEWPKETKTLEDYRSEFRDSTSAINALGGDSVVRMIKFNDQVECYRVDWTYEKIGENSSRVTGLRVINGPVTIAQEDWIRIAEMFTSVESYDLQALCTFNPDLLLRISHDQNLLEIMVCLSCGQIQVVHPEELIYLTDSASKLLLDYALSAFPDDLELKAMSVR